MPGFHYFFQFQKILVDRFTWPHSQEQDSLHRWRAFILSSILIAAFILGVIAFISVAFLIVEKNAWGLAITDAIGLLLCIVFLFVHRIRFEIRASVTLLVFYGIGVAVISSVGFLSGGLAWLFGFAVLAGVLLGNQAAWIAIFMNAVFLMLIGMLTFTGNFTPDFPFFSAPHELIAAGINFVVLNAITAVSVAALLNVLNEREKRYRLIAENVADVIWTMDRDFNYTYISPSIFQLQGFTPEEGIEKSIGEMVVPESLEKIIELYEEKRHLLDSDKEGAQDPVIFEAELYRKDGTTVWTNIHAVMITGQGNEVNGILGITRDITERKKNEAEKINAQIIAGEHKKLALVGQVAGKMAHDFNNVLGVIMGHAELALLDCNDPEINKTLEFIISQTLRGKNLTKNLTAFAKMPEAKQESFLLNDKIDFVLNLLEDELNGITVLKEDVKAGQLIADPGMIEHALVNLIQNSIHALSLTDNPKIFIRTDCVDKKVVFEIEDNGCGIPEEHLEAVYEPSFTLKGSRDLSGQYESTIKGTGYGMVNVKKYIELHKGTISIVSSLESGTKVMVSLPVIETELTADPKYKQRASENPAVRQILLVEDEPEISDIQYSILTHPPCNYKVDVAPNGQVALDLFKKNKYDLISLDYSLPGKMNGKDVYSHLRKMNTFIPILFISGNIEFLESIKDLKQKDPNLEHLSKPCKNIDYVNRIDMLMEGKSVC